MKSIQNDYRSYLLRMWRASMEEGTDWRASLEEVSTGELHGFPNLAALYGYLQALDCKDRKDESVRKQPAE